MEKKNIFTKVLAVVGALLIWFPILAPIVLSAIVAIADGVFRLDYLMPAELFPSALVGGGLLLWAALRARTQWKLIGWSLGSAVLAFVIILAVGEVEPGSWQWMLVIALLAIYSLALVATGIGGILLLRKLFNKHSR